MGACRTAPRSSRATSRVPAAPPEPPCPCPDHRDRTGRKTRTCVRRGLGAFGHVGRALEPACLARVLQLEESLRLDLAHALAGDTDLGADLLERHRALAREAVAQ